MAFAAPPAHTAAQQTLSHNRMEIVTTHSQRIRKPDRGRQRFPFSPNSCLFMGGRAFGPPLCRGCAPATPPYKNMPHRPCVLFPSIVSGERSLPPTCRLNQPTSNRRSYCPLTPAVPPQFPCSSPAVPRPRNAPLQKHASPTVFTLPQHRVWRTESTPHLPPKPTDLQPQKLLTPAP